jgi:two-component system chemotaxis sensor kinase CheA
MSGVSDMVLARNELARRLRESSGDVTVDDAFERLSGIIAEMRDAITRTRMQRIENLFVALPRMVRDLAESLISRCWSISRAAMSSSIAK